ncbi:MAG: ABC transporter permease [Anaerolineaceae bacterium]|nr:ABC transporter permease [Anaerolineaceae bacterium]NMC17059.1 ABC transporter permease [Chloroflexota bacterium]HNW14023.1 ABC transporter permease [Anaerolineaceae bacterium]HOE01912.1 ABC transporter permease [Anaerolineaceae bacterium]HQK05362.1 ABC transporter permease [Anaerolineaceae bacterium]
MGKKDLEKQDIGKTILEELTGGEPKEKRQKRGIWKILQIPALAILTGLIIGAVLIMATSFDVYDAFKVSLWKGLGTAFAEVGEAYLALITGSLGNPVEIVQALLYGDALDFRNAINPILESLVQSTPYIFAGLACALGFRAGLFNIGVEGQLFIGAAAATFVGYSLTGLPPYIHMPLAFLAGALGGALWGMVPGLLKATTGGHEVINCIMMNYIAYRFTTFLLTGPMSRPGTGGMPVSPIIEKSAQIPQFFKTPIRFHLGFFIALAFAALVWWVLFKTTLGLNLRTVGTNPRAAKYAGMNIIATTIIGMAASGALAGMAGANEVLAVNRSMAIGLSAGYGFDSIALALLGNSHPVGVIFAALLFGVLKNGATKMMVVSTIPIDIVTILQAVILIFVAAPAIIRSVYRLKQPKVEAAAIMLSGWGGVK